MKPSIENKLNPTRLSKFSSDFLLRCFPFRERISAVRLSKGANIGGGAVTTFEVKIPPFSTLKIHRSLEIGFEKKNSLVANIKKLNLEWKGKVEFYFADYCTFQIQFSGPVVARRTVIWPIVAAPLLVATLQNKKKRTFQN